MPKFNKPLPEMLNAVWASEALSQNNVYPDVDYVEEGWLQIKPPYEYENAINYKHDQFIAHINQLGVVEWDSETEYQANKSYVQSGNLIYKCIQTHTNRSPSTAGNEAFWEVFEGNRQATSTSRGVIRVSNDSESSALSSVSTAITPAGVLKALGQSTNASSRGYYEIITRGPSGNKRTIVRQWGSVSLNVGSVLAQNSLYVFDGASSDSLPRSVSNITSYGFSIKDNPNTFNEFVSGEVTPSGVNFRAGGIANSNPPATSSNFTVNWWSESII